MGAKYARDNDMAEFQDDFRKGAMLAQDNAAFEALPLLTDDEREVLRREVTHRWSHPMALYHMVTMCSLAAAVQGMDESVINGGEKAYMPCDRIFVDGVGLQQICTFSSNLALKTESGSRDLSTLLHIFAASP
jgi:hypothetical protein